MRRLFVHLVVGLCAFSAKAESAPNTLPLRDITFAGNKTITAAELRRALPIKLGQQLPWAVLGKGELRVSFIGKALLEPLGRLYLERGFVEHEIDGKAVELRPAKGGIWIHVVIKNEGPRFQMGRLTVAGLDGRQVARGVQTGQTFNALALYQGLGQLARSLRDRGHAAVEVTPELSLDRKRRVVDVHLAVETGAVYRVESVALRGNQRVRASIIHRALSFARGDRYNESALEQSRQRLMASGYFESVDLELSPGRSGNGIVVTVVATERADCPRVDAT
jgi:outer membrane protein assembly factor BamA